MPKLNIYIRQYRSLFDLKGVGQYSEATILSDYGKIPRLRRVETR